MDNSDLGLSEPAPPSPIPVRQVEVGQDLFSEGLTAAQCDFVAHATDRNKAAVGDAGRGVDTMSQRYEGIFFAVEDEAPRANPA